jgi:hypothetical protein
MTPAKSKTPRALNAEETKQLNARRTARAKELDHLPDRLGVEKLVSTEEAAKLLHILPQTIRRWSCEGSGPSKPRKVCRRLLWPVAAIEKLLTGKSAAA